MNVDDSRELRWIREALEEKNALLKEQNKQLKEIATNLENIYGGIM